MVKALERSAIEAMEPASKRSRSDGLMQNGDNIADVLIRSPDPQHPANYICELCRKFYTFGWVTGTGGGVSIRHGDRIFLAPSGVEKELMQPEHIFVMDYASKEYLRCPPVCAHMRRV